MLEFPRGITGIVGPNGCGKSNIVDALRWVLGEQSAKHLRGQVMEDVIFAGNDRYAPLGLAEVSITLDTDGPLPTIAESDDEPSPIASIVKEAAEIEVTRRLFRSGESEYAVNGRTCRLRDITELFLGTGVGTKAYSIIEQGRVGQIVNAKPDEVRLFIEEAAGTTLYRARKLAAERKIERTRNNLLRVSDIVAELERQAGSLRRQVRGALRYQELRREEDLLDRTLALLKFAALARRREEIDQLLAGERSREAAARDAVRELVASRDAARDRQAHSERQADDVRREFYERRGRLATLVQERQFLEQRQRELEASYAAATSELSGLVGRLGVVRNDAIEVERLRGACENERFQLGETASTSEAELAMREEALVTVSREVDEARNRAMAALAEEVRLTNECSSLARQREMAAARLSRLRDEDSSLGTLAQQLIAVIAQSRSRLDDVVIEIDSTTSNRDAATRKVGEISLRRRTAEEVADHRKNDVAALESRYNSLQELSEGFSGYGEGVRTIMSNGAHDLVSASAVIADVIDIEPGYERAVAAVLADRLQYVVVPTADDGLRGASYLRESGAGRASFIPLDSLDEGAGASNGSAPPRGFSWLRDHLQIKEGYEKPVQALLGRVAVGPSLSGVVGEWRASTKRTTLVSTDGEVLESTGVVTGGSGKPVDEGILARKAELRGIRIKLVDAEVKAREARASFEKLIAEAEAAGQDLANFDRRLHELTVARVGAEGELELQRQNLSRTRDRAVSLATEIDSLVREDSQLREQHEQLRARMETAAADRHRAEDSTRSLENDKRRLEAEREQARGNLAAVQVRAAALAEQLQSFAQRASSASALESDLDARRIALEERSKRDALELETATARLRDPDVSIERADEDLKAASGRCEQVDAVVVDARDSLAMLEKRMDELNGELDAARERKSGLELTRKECELERGAVENGLRDRLGLGEAELLGDPSLSSPEGRDVEAVSEDLERVRASIRRLGTVNVGAVTELEEIDTRLSELVTQRDDLEKSIEDLRGTIAQLNRLSRQRFKDTFDRVNEIFHTTFPRLFQGGRAWLALTDENNLLETGVEIFVQPPGKRLGNIDLLSGGEKALTAVSLIFSLFLHKPSPFCVLDEVDAPLDDANIGRFARLVDEMSDRSQFLLITHNKKTMESCDTLYGVTMREPGVSKIVSVEMAH